MQPRCWKGVAGGFPPGFALQRDDGSGFLIQPHNSNPVEMLLASQLPEAATSTPCPAWPLSPTPWPALARAKTVET